MYGHRGNSLGLATGGGLMTRELVMWMLSRLVHVVMIRRLAHVPGILLVMHRQLQMMAVARWLLLATAVVEAVHRQLMHRADACLTDFACQPNCLQTLDPAMWYGSRASSAH